MKFTIGFKFRVKVKKNRRQSDFQVEPNLERRNIPNLNCEYHEKGIKLRYKSRYEFGCIVHMMKIVTVVKCLLDFNHISRLTLQKAQTNIAFTGLNYCTKNKIKISKFKDL